MYNGAFILINIDNVLIAGTYFRGKVYEWYSVYLKDHLTCIDTPSNREEGTKEIMNTYDGFEKALNQHFGDVDQKRITKKQIKVLKQTKSVLNYTAEF
jgi:hypothetical protein